MIFTQREIQDLFHIIDYRIARVIADVLGKEFLLPQDLEVFRDFDFDFLTEVGKLTPYYQSFIFGRLSSTLSPEQLKTLNYKDVTAYVKQDQYKRLSPRERAEFNAAATRSYGYIKGIGNKVKETLGNSLAEEELKSTVESRKMETLNAISEETMRGVIERRSVKAIVYSIGNRLDDWNRDWGRIVETEMHNIYSIGQAQVIMADHGLDARVYKEVYSGACTNCRRLFTTGGSGSKPRIFKLRELINNGDNIGKKAKDWLPVIGSVHPWCRCLLRYIPEGYEWDEEKGSFEPPKNYVRKVERKSKVTVTVGNKVFIV